MMTQVDSSSSGLGFGGRCCFNDLGQKKEPFMVLKEVFYVNGPFCKSHHAAPPLDSLAISGARPPRPQKIFRWLSSAHHTSVLVISSEAERREFPSDHRIFRKFQNFWNFSETCPLRSTSRRRPIVLRAPTKFIYLNLSTFLPTPLRS